MKNSIIFFCFIFLRFGIRILSANESAPLCIDSDFVSFDGKLITLNGNSTVDHELGKVSAQNITLVSEDKGKKWRFAFLKMKGDVKISMQDGGTLTCGEAEMDYQKLNGKFSGGAHDGYVIYTEYLQRQKSDPKVTVPLEVKSREMSVRIQSENKLGASTLFVNHITAENDVSINYNQDFFAWADYGQFERAEPVSTHPSKMAGILSLYAYPDFGLCRVSSRNGDLIDANKINIDTTKQELFFESPHGTFLTGGEEKTGEIVFSCETMSWHELQDVLILQNQVEVLYKGVGTLSNPNEIRLYRKVKEGHKQVSLVECLGKSVLCYQDEKKGVNHVLTTHSKFVLDHGRLQAHMDSPRDSDRKVVDNLQVHFSDPTGEIFADEVFIFYQEINKKLVPEKLLLRGNVWLLTRTSVDKDDPGKIVQFAMADRVEYVIATKEMLCLADFGKRVLFFDKANNLQISAPSVKAKRNPQTQKDAIQGIGDVRFSFIDKEFEQMKKRFSDYDLN